MKVGPTGGAVWAIESLLQAGFPLPGYWLPADGLRVKGPPLGLNAEALFGNFADVVAMSGTLVGLLAEQQALPPDEQSLVPPRLFFLLASF